MSHFPPKEFYRWQYHHHAYRRFGFFRRFFWFGLGAGVMAFWGHRRQEIENGNGNGARHGQEWRRWCRERHSIQQQQQLPQQQIDAVAATAPNWEYPGGAPVNPTAAYNRPPTPASPASHCPLHKARAQANANANANVADPQNPSVGMQQNFSPENFGPSFASFERSQQEFRAHQQAIEARVNELMKQTSDTVSFLHYSWLHTIYV